VTLLMADHNLLALPVVDEQDRMIGLITVDDVLELQKAIKGPSMAKPLRRAKRTGIMSPLAAMIHQL
jgi:Mg/Co/Ni transporter MgtE